jgi:hypothetical protein
MRLTFLTPTAALIAFAALLPLAAALLAARRADRVRAALGLARPSRAGRLLPVAALALAAALLGVAAAQPILERDLTLRVRSGTEAFVLVDVSRSMLARSDPEATTRLERAQAAAVALREGLAGVRVGLGSLTDRVLPHLFPSSDEEAFGLAVERTLAIERPPPRENLSLNATTLDALTGLATRNFFSREARHRLAVVVTDGESRAVNEISIAARLRRPPAVETVFVHVWDDGERVYSQGVPEPEYRPDTTSRDRLERLADANDGAVFAEGELGAAVARSRELLGEAPSVAVAEKRERRPLGPYLTLAAFLPLGLLLGRLSR